MQLTKDALVSTGASPFGFPAVGAKPSRGLPINAMCVSAPKSAALTLMLPLRLRCGAPRRSASLGDRRFEVQESGSDSPTSPLEKRS